MARVAARCASGLDPGQTGFRDHIEPCREPFAYALFERLGLPPTGPQALARRWLSAFFPED